MPTLGHAGTIGPGPVVLFLLLVAAHSTFCAVTASRALDWLRGRRDQPLGLLWALGAPAR